MLDQHGLMLQEAAPTSQPDHRVKRPEKLRLREDFPPEAKETIRWLREAGFRWPPEGSFP